ncbi:glycosyl transferase family 25 [Neorhizobium galegae]|uniref:glycosyltransferase family 25 protein n=1 Tax=Neorhizobium galegae TaxID=399 RepID=UPI001AE1EFD7|nr:glycosyltransferase family 25 protein [Neorhizobium galegae]MBP2548912.1 glycosyl transferase family 25 [Neorhizobium galegae]
MTIYVINLDRALDRMARMQALLTERGLAFERIEAVDGKTLSPETLQTWSPSHADGSLVLSVGEVGCLLSHRQVWQKVVEKGEPGVVLEDDLHVAPASSALLRSLDWLPADADLVKLETTGKTIVVSRAKQPVASAFCLMRLVGAHLGTGAYIVTPKAAKMLLAAVSSSNQAIDHLMFDPASPLFSRLATYQISPALCIQDQFLKTGREGLDGDIVRSWAIRKPRLKPVQKLKRELLRLVAQAGVAIAGSRLNPLSTVRNVRIAFSPTQP